MEEMNDDFREELAQLPQILRKLKEKGNEFTVPANYFEQLADDILQKVPTGNQVAPSAENEVAPSQWINRILRVADFLFRPQLAIGLATAASIITIAILLFPIRKSSSGSQLASKPLTEEEIAGYVSANIDDFDTDLIIRHLGVILEDESFPIMDLEDQELEKVVEGFLDDMDLQDLEELL